jgi:hypothetical protein
MKHSQEGDGGGGGPHVMQDALGVPEGHELHLGGFSQPYKHILLSERNGNRSLLHVVHCDAVASRKLSATMIATSGAIDRAEMIIRIDRGR